MSANSNNASSTGFINMSVEPTPAENGGNLQPISMPLVQSSNEQSKGALRWAALFLGELRDGLTMINMQASFLIVAKSYTEKQVGLLFFVFGMSQFLFQTPAGYLYDYTESKVLWLSIASVTTTLLTLVTVFFAEEYGTNILLMVLIKFVQGAVTSFIPPGLNSITQGIVGAIGMTSQVSMNEMMNHLGTAIIVLSGSLIAFSRFPNIGSLFIVSPIACVGVLFFLNQINPKDIDHNAARGLTTETAADKKAKKREARAESAAAAVEGVENLPDYVPPPITESSSMSTKASTKAPISNIPSFALGWGNGGNNNTRSSVSSSQLKPDTPLQVLRDPTLLVFILVIFLFHTANGTILPLVMQTLAIGNGRNGILFSGLCIIVAQVFMVLSAKVCGTYSQIYGRKKLFTIGLFSVPLRCLLLYILLNTFGDLVQTSLVVQMVILSTQILDGVGAGVYGTMYILVSSDVSGGTGRFSLILGITTAAASIGGTVSGYLGEALAQDLGYRQTYLILMFMSMVPAIFYVVCMPETLPAYAMKSKQGGISNIHSIKEVDEEHNGGISLPTIAKKPESAIV